jgi:signal transduction histidine kinase
MNAQPSSPSRLGITRRIALLSWLVTIVTLVIFMWVIIPEQERTYLESLESKARGISASLQDVTAGGVVTEDYSSVVDHCKQVLHGDQSISFLIISKNDGFSLIHQTGGRTNSAGGAVILLEAQWRTDTLNEYWRPARRTVRSGIAAVPVFNQRLFHYAKPFDYSGIEWGWVHVGLSLEAYDQSVKGVYQRTGLLAVICLLFSLGASLVYAKRLVRPLHDLNAVVSRISAGDLTARADILTGDEIQELAQSFTTMTDALLQRDRILESVRIAAQQFLTSADWRQVIDAVLAKIGQAARLARISLHQNRTTSDGIFAFEDCCTWMLHGGSPAQNPTCGQCIPWHGAGFDLWESSLRRGDILTVQAQDMAQPFQGYLDQLGLRTLLVVPILVENGWWGFFCFAALEPDRRWTDAERDSFRTAADMLGAAIARHRAQAALLEAKNTLEQRVQERTRELEEQMAAKEKAHAELAEAQQRLIETSRLAGMAEVATGVLHNVGNVLNSVNVSCTLSIDRLRLSKLANLPRVTAMLDQQNGNLGDFLTHDPKGKQIPGYLSSLAPVLVKEQAEVLNELNSLRDKIDHIKEIVSMQQSYARVSGVAETMAVTQLVEDALKLNLNALARHDIRVERHFEDVPLASLEKHKILQILLNLIRNAKHALEESDHEPKVMTLRVFSPKPGHVAIAVRDNGVGIPPENLTKVFAHGFTTRKDGHGFGLHSGAIAARELRGSLTADSAGPGQGATFTLELPLNKESPS